MQGRVAVISGSSRGIGAAIAAELSQRGASIVLNYPFGIDKAECEGVGKSLKTPWLAVEADLSSIEGPKQLIDAAIAKFGKVDILVHNAAVVHLGSTEELTTDKFQQSIDLNVRGAFLLVKHTLPHFPPYKSSGTITGGVRGGSRIIIIGSGASQLPQPGALFYAATKGALESMIRVWSFELPPKYGCTVNGVAPGPVATEQMRISLGGHLEEMQTIFDERTPCEGVLAEVDDVSWMVATLAEDRSKWVNGQYIHVSGGLVRS